MIDQLITALSQEVGMSTEEIADTIWLALQIQESPSESVSSDFSSVKEDIGAIENKITSPESQPQNQNSNGTGKNQDSEAQKARIYPQSQQQTESLDLSFKTPNAPSLRQPLTLARALKPLMRRIPAGTNFVLDETATIERIANTRLWLPVLRPTLEPWLDLELVVDESISMQIWRQTIRDLEKLLKNYGIFRDVRVWGMTANDGEKVQVRRGIGAAAKNKFPRSSKELIDGSGRRLILVVSDCVSSYWRDGKVTKALEIWANSVPTAIIQMLPKWLWKRTALGRASEVRLRALTPGVSNQNLIAREVSLWEELEEKKGVKVPIFTLEEDKATTWAQMLSGKSSVSTLGFVFKLDAPVKENRLFNLDYSQLSAEERVQAFRVTASPMARKLAGLLAAAPVISLPVVRLIRGALLPESLQVNVAEVFLGGLLKPLSEIKVETHPDDVVYGFVDGVRELFIDSMPSDRVLEVVDKVSEYVAERVGLSLENFAAVLRREKKVENSGVVEEVGHFATVTAQVLRRLGGEYGKVAEELERNYITETDFTFAIAKEKREKLVILNFGSGNFTEGFENIKAYIWSDEHPLPISFTSNLPSELEIPQLYQEWSQKHEQLRECFQDLGSFSRIKIKKNQTTNFPSDTEIQIKEIISQLKQLEKNWRFLLNNWLSFPSFSRIENQLRTKIKPSEAVRVIIQSEDVLMHRIPWHFWNFFQDYQFAEFAISLSEGNVEKLPIAREKIRILAIFGYDKGLNIEVDKQYLKSLLTEAKVLSLVKPSLQELERKLWDEKGWDMIYFSGASNSEVDGSTGRFYLGNETVMTIEKLENALTTAISRGLQLAIFNSCDGLGLARQLAKLNIPTSIVMREDIPDIVAQDFLNNFLQLFSSGKSLYISVRQAREKLQVMEDKFPGASWLPVIFQNPAELPPSWQGFQRVYEPNLAVALAELRSAIEVENWLTLEDKMEALQQVDILAKVGEFPTGENRRSVKSATRMLRGIAAEYPSNNLMDEALKLLTDILF